MIDYRKNISESQLTIYDPIDPGAQTLYIPTYSLEAILSRALIGVSLSGLRLRTRSKVVKSEICRALGYPVPSSFKKTHPRFLGQNFDVYTQKSNNVQIWNEDIDDERRYVIIRTDKFDTISGVRVIEGHELVQFDRTGTMTHKYQARMQSYSNSFCSSYDTDNIRDWLREFDDHSLRYASPNQLPKPEQLMKIAQIYDLLLPLIGKTINYIDAIQERNRGAELHAMICKRLGYSEFDDDGSYPDIKNQLLEIKLQTSPTIDLGLHSPEDGKRVLSVDGKSFYSEDIRYAIFEGKVYRNTVSLINLYLVTGEQFSDYFPLFQGKVVNAKKQLPLPRDFFD